MDTQIAVRPQLKTNRGLIKYILLTIVTFGIYPIVFWTSLGNKVNFLRKDRGDKKKTMNYCLIYFLFSWMTFGIVNLVWMHRVSNRIGRELAERNIPYAFSATDYWLWGFWGSLLVFGPFLYMHRVCKAMNLICADYNEKG